MEDLGVFTLSLLSIIPSAQGLSYILFQSQSINFILDTPVKSFVKNLAGKVNLESFTNTSTLLDVAPHNMGLDILNVIENQVTKIFVNKQLVYN